MDEIEESTYNHSTAAVVAFAKNPAIEPVKTRLAASVGDEMARSIFDALFTDCLIGLKRLNGADRYVACSPDSGHSYFEKLTHDYGVGLVDQHGNSLGERMLSCVETFCDRYRPVVIVGTDTPIMPIEDLNLAISISAEWDVLLGPTFDGGYYLIAMSRNLPEVFEGVEWSTNTVLEQTRDNCARHNFKLKELPAALDVDDIESLLHLVRLLNESPGEGQATRAILKLFDLV